MAATRMLALGFLLATAACFKNQVQKPQDAGESIADMVALFLESPTCKKNTGDTELLAGRLQGKYDLVTCRGDDGGLVEILFVPKDAAFPYGQSAYEAPTGLKLLRGRLVDHYLVLQFDTQTQYLDLLKAEKRGEITVRHLAGFVADQKFTGFEDVVIFKDALKNYAGVKEDSELLSKISALTLKIAGGKKYRLQTQKVDGSWIVSIQTDGDYIQAWPEIKKS